MNKTDFNYLKKLSNDLCVSNEAEIKQSMSYDEAHRIIIKEFDKKFGGYVNEQ